MSTPEQTANRQRLVTALRKLADNGKVDIPDADSEAGHHFHWDFNQWLVRNGEFRGPKEPPCGSIGCALGLAKELKIIDHSASAYDLASAIGLYSTDHTIFSGNWHYDKPFREVTAADVADAIEKLAY